MDMTSAQGEASQTRIGFVVADIRARLAQGQGRAGARLPSIRHLAKALAVSPSTVVEAYDRLVAEGVVQARKGSGFYASPNQAIEPKRAAAELARPPVVDPFWVSRQSLDYGPEYAKPGCGWLPADWMPNAALAAGLRAAGRNVEALTSYGSARGTLLLRQLVSRRLYAQSIHVDEDQLLLTSGATQSLDLCLRLLLKAGDTVLLDDPCYFNFQTILAAHQLRAISVPFTENGPDIAIFAEKLQQERPKIYITNSALHNPTGASLKPQIAFQILSLIAKANMLIIEDDIFADFEPEPSLTYAALGGMERVLRIGSFSKTLSASLRCGYIGARADWIQALIDLQLASHFGGPGPLVEQAIASALSSGSYRKHLEQVHRRLETYRSEVAERLAALGIVPWLMPKGGFYLWCRLPEGVSANALAQTALQRGIVLAPGNVFSPSLGAENFMRFNVAQMADARPWRLLQEAMM